MEFLEYKNYIDTIIYDNKGFAKDASITFSNDNSNGFSHINIKLVNKDEEKYTYKIIATENYAGYDSTASGTVTFNYNQCGITSIDNGRLSDMYDECFSVESSKYKHLIYQSPQVMD
jgi:hypothetical protein